MIKTKRNVFNMKALNDELNWHENEWIWNDVDNKLKGLIVLWNIQRYTPFFPFFFFFFVDDGYFVERC